jgi:predicted membrane protein
MKNVGLPLQGSGTFLGIFFLAKFVLSLFIYISRERTKVKVGGEIPNVFKIINTFFFFYRVLLIGRFLTSISATIYKEVQLKRTNVKE